MDRALRQVRRRRMLATLGVDQSLRSFVGRWSKQGAADVYVRTSLRVTENLQKLAAAHARDSFSGGADHFGEEHLLGQLRAHLQSQGVTETAIEAQVRWLTVADFSKHPVPLNHVSPAGNLEEQTAGEVLVPIEDSKPAEASDLNITVALVCGDIELVTDSVLECAAQVRGNEEVDEAPKGFVISSTRGGRVRRVHFVGGCFRIPGEDYRDFVDLGQRAPEAHKITHRCKDCFPLEKATERAVEDGGGRVVLQRRVLVQQREPGARTACHSGGGGRG